MVRHPVTSKGKQYNYYVCSSHKKDAKLCSIHSINEDILISVVLGVLRQHINQIVELDELLSFCPMKTNVSRDSLTLSNSGGRQSLI